MTGVFLIILYIYEIDIQPANKPIIVEVHGSLARSALYL